MMGSTQLIFGTEEALEHEHFNRDSGCLCVTCRHQESDSARRPSVTYKSLAVFHNSSSSYSHTPSRFHHLVAWCTSRICRSEKFSPSVLRWWNRIVAPYFASISRWIILGRLDRPCNLIILSAITLNHFEIIVRNWRNLHQVILRHSKEILYLRG